MSASGVRSTSTTYVIIGQPPARRGARRFTESLPDRLLRRLPGVDVRIVADRQPSDQ